MMLSDRSKNDTHFSTICAVSIDTIIDVEKNAFVRREIFGYSSSIKFIITISYISGFGHYSMA